MNILKSYYHHYTIISKNIQYKYKIKIVCIIWKYSYKKAVISLGFVQNYTIRLFKVNKSTCNEDKIVNEVDRKFNNRRSMSSKGCPYDNAVSEATYNIFKTEFVMNNFIKETLNKSTVEKANR